MAELDAVAGMLAQERAPGGEALLFCPKPPPQWGDGAMPAFYNN